MNTITRILSILADDPEAAILALAVFAAGGAVALGLLAQLVRAVASGLSAAQLPRAASVAARIADGLLATGLHLRELARASRGLGPVAQSLPPPAKGKDDDDDDITPIGPKAPPSIVTLSILVLTFAGCAGLGCGSGPVREFENLAHTARDVADVAESCSFAAKEAEMSRCLDDGCKAKVLARYSVIADVLDAFAAAWCAASPDSEGCK